MLDFTPTDTLGASPPPRGEQLALQAIPAGQVVFPAAGVSLPRRTHQAAVTSVRDVPAGTAGARTRAHVAPGGALVRAHSSGEVVRKEKHRCK